MEIDVNSYADILEIIGDYKPVQRLEERLIIEFCEEFGLKDGVKFSMVGYRGDWLLFCNYIVECYSKLMPMRPFRNKQFAPSLILWEIMGKYELRKKFNAETIDKIDKDLVLTEEDIIEISGLPEEWLLFVTYILEKYSFHTKK
jgi:hypothetical protein